MAKLNSIPTTNAWNAFSPTLTLAAIRLEDNSLLLVVPDKHPETVLADYAQRWSIETLVGAFKTREFCLESTHCTDDYHLHKLVALLSVGLGWVFLTGLWGHHNKPLKINPHGRREKSLFR